MGFPLPIPGVYLNGLTPKANLSLADILLIADATNGLGRKITVAAILAAFPSSIPYQFGVTNVVTAVGNPPSVLAAGTTIPDIAIWRKPSYLIIDGLIVQAGFAWVAGLLTLPDARANNSLVTVCF